ncbi:putative uncharacterized protein DDB_G0282133 isoform X2 [Polistes fuscatus]|uniref:putative uncharacterized protein DDB_G0282133 isoform X2 n=1 Tax=Polistes fuscatus TaxID=30207 RepID=UPI001CA93591|nr:putative uncharacterized protein DDB_G0282133 isoform X2 [Polistes fuscatus]
MERPQSLKDQCLESNILDLEEYISTLKFAKVPTIDSMVVGFEFPMATLPFGILRSDWTRLLLLRNVQEKGSILAEKLEFLFKILIIAYQNFEQSLPSKKFFNGTNNSVSENTGETKLTKSNFSFNIEQSQIPSGNTNSNIIPDNRGDINENEINENREKEENVEHVSMEYNTNVKGNKVTNSMNNHNNSKVITHTNSQGFTKADCLKNTIKSFSTVRINKLLTNTGTPNDRNNQITKVRISNESNNEKVLTIPLSISLEISLDGANIKVPMSTKKIESLDNSTNIIKSDYAETSTEGLNSIDCCLSTVRTDILEETVSQEIQMETNSNNIIHLNDSDETGNLNIKENQSMNFTTSRINPNEVKKDENIDDSFSTGVEKSDKLNVSLGTIKNDNINNYNFANINETNKSDKSFDSSTSNDFNSTLILPTDLKKLTTVEIVNSTKSNDKKNPMESSVNSVTNYEDNTRATISKILPILKSNNSTHPSNVATTNSMDYFNPSASSSIYDVFTQKTDSSIDRFHHKVGDKLKKLPVFREQPPGHVTKDHKANVELSSLVSKTITFLTDSITETNRFKEHPSNPLKRDRINNPDIEKNYRLFYNYGGRLPEKIRKYDRNILDFIRIKCKNECT